LILTHEEEPQTNFRIVKKLIVSEETRPVKYSIDLGNKSPKRQIENRETLNRVFNPTHFPKPTGQHTNTIASHPQQHNGLTNLPPHLKSVLMQKKKDVTFLPPPEFFKKRRIIQNINFAQWKAQAVLKYIPGKPEKEEDDGKFDDLDDFTSLLSKRLFENLEETDAAQGFYTITDGDYNLLVHQERNEKKKEDLLLVRETEKKPRATEELIPGPCCRAMRTEDKRNNFNREEKSKFEGTLKDRIYDCQIRIGRYYQAFIPEIKASTAYNKSSVIFGLPPKKGDIILHPKLTIEYKPKGKLTKPANASLENKMDIEARAEASFSEEQVESMRMGGYISHDNFEGDILVESFYVCKRNLSDYLEWDPLLVEDEEVIDMIEQTLQDFKTDPRVNKEALYDYLKMCKLNVEKFLDHLEMDHEDFRRYIFMITHKGA
jgi:hypothetical protein